MTNLVATLTLMLATNWTACGQTEMVGYRSTNTVATLIYRGATNEMTVHADEGQIIWIRKPQVKATILNNNSVKDTASTSAN